MRTAGHFRFPAGSVVIGMAVVCASCATVGRPQQFRTFLTPPQDHSPRSTEEPRLEPPSLAPDLYSSELPFLAGSSALAPVPIAAPTDADLVIKRADDRLEAGRQAAAEGRVDEARKDFDEAIDTLLAAPDSGPDRPRVERRLEEMVETIYRYDLDQLGAAGTGDQISYDKSPGDEILEMTFPVDPSLRSKVIEQIRATTSQLPLEESDAVVGAINFFSSARGKKILAAGLRRQGKYKEMIERALREEGLPQELIFVAQAESGFLPRAVSNKACVGLWQFAQFRGREYGLEQTASTDDRMDPEMATRAAAHHLHDLYNHFGDWYLALAAYHCGPGCVDHAVMRTGYADFWTLARLNVLPKPTTNYVPVILAMTIMAKNAKDYGLDGLEPDSELEFDTVELPSPTHLALVADAVERPLSEVKELNPAVLRSVAPAGYRLHVPKGSLPALEAAFAVVPANRRAAWRVHRVRAGDTFAALARQYKAQAGSVSLANHEELPGEGEWAAIPVSYPGDRIARTASTRKPTRKTPRKTARKTTGARVTAHSAGTRPGATQLRKKAAAAHKTTAKSARRRTSGPAAGAG